MEELFRKRFWIVQAVAVAASGLLLAGAAANVGASFLAPFAVTYPEDDSGGRAGGAIARDTPAPPIDSELFGKVEPPPPPPDPCATVTCPAGQVCHPDSGTCVPDPGTPGEAEIAGDRCTETDLPIFLAGTMVAQDERWSVAILRNPSTNKTQFAGMGTRIMNEGEVTRIERSRVFLSRNGRTECLRPGDAQAREKRRQGQQKPAAPTPKGPPGATPADPNALAPPAPVAASQAGNAGLDAVVAQSVQKVSDTEFTIKRDAIDQIGRSSDYLQRQAPRVVPNYRDGRPNGFRLQGVRSDSLFNQIGIRNGDVIQAVNGTAIDSPQRALELYQQLLTSNRVELVVERRGRPETIVYNIQ